MLCIQAEKCLQRNRVVVCLFTVVDNTGSLTLYMRTLLDDTQTRAGRILGASCLTMNKVVIVSSFCGLFSDQLQWSDIVAAIRYGWRRVESAIANPNTTILYTIVHSGDSLFYYFS